MQTPTQSSLSKIAILTFIVVVIIDQLIKFYIKLNFSLNEYVTLIPHFMELRFVENKGMAFGWELPGIWGKIILTLFRVIAVIAIGYYLRDLIRKKSSKGLIICVALILAGAVGNIIDSLIYGLIFSVSSLSEIASFFPDHGYESFLRGHVVDMFQFTVRWPDWDWFPWRRQLVFPPIFNLADAAISVGVILILIKQKSFFAKEKENKKANEEPAIEPVSTKEIAK